MSDFNVGDLIRCRDYSGLIELMSREDPWNWTDGVHDSVDRFKKSMKKENLEITQISEIFVTAKNSEEEFDFYTEALSMFEIVKKEKEVT